MMVCSMLSAWAQFSGSGSGTESDPYIIRNAVQLSQMANFCGQDGVVFLLQKDVDITDWLIDEGLTRQGWSPVGTSSQPFKGKLIGNGKKISGIVILRESESNVGFFGCMDGATISDLTLECTTIAGSSYLGAFAGNAVNSSITNCHVKVSGGLSSASGEYVGGFMGCASNCTFTDCSVKAVVTGTGAKYVGGFGGGATDGTTISGVTANVTVSSSNECAGGLLGFTNTATITNTTVTGNVTGTSCVAGFIAKAEGTDNITNCTYRGDLNGDTNIGGISAYLAEGSSCTFTSCCTRGKITATGDYVGGIVGVSQGACIAEMEKCSHYGDIYAESYVGGVIGSIDAYCQEEPVRNHYTLCGSSTYISSPLAYFENDSDKLVYIGSVYDELREGTEDNCSVNNCIAIGNIKGNSFVGGIIGKNYSSKKYTTKNESKSFTYSVRDNVNYYYKYLFKYTDKDFKWTYVNYNSGRETYTVKYRCLSLRGTSLLLSSGVWHQILISTASSGNCTRNSKSRPYEVAFKWSRGDKVLLPALSGLVKTVLMMQR